MAVLTIIGYGILIALSALALAGLGFQIKAVIAKQRELARYNLDASSEAVGYRRDPRVIEKIRERVEYKYRKARNAAWVPFIGLFYVLVSLAATGVLIYGLVWLVAEAWH